MIGEGLLVNRLKGKCPREKRQSLSFIKDWRQRYRVTTTSLMA